MIKLRKHEKLLLPRWRYDNNQTSILSRNLTQKHKPKTKKPPKQPKQPQSTSRIQSVIKNLSPKKAKETQELEARIAEGSDSSLVDIGEGNSDGTRTLNLKHITSLLQIL